MMVHVEISKRGGDVPLSYFSQALMWAKAKDLPWFFVVQEKGSRANHRHIHMLCLMFIANEPAALANLRRELRAWFHDNHPDESQRERCRDGNGYALYLSFPKSHQTQLLMLGYLLKDRGKPWSRMDGACWAEERYVRRIAHVQLQYACRVAD